MSSCGLRCYQGPQQQSRLECTDHLAVERKGGGMERKDSMRGKKMEAEKKNKDGERRRRGTTK